MEDRSHRKGHQQNATQDAAERHHLAWYAPGHHVAVAHRGHSDYGPPVASGDTGELLGVGHLVLNQVQQGGKKGDGYTEEEQQQPELAGAAPGGQAQCLQAQRMPGEAHDIQNPQGTEYTQHQAHFVQIAVP
ncbi:hypothetical protein GDO78_019655 [Eleutherodactylus coqui]|uniref:Uncharacterized protein n=1 Tax=Eleutherodactylus coqui TaxID=57060 RepID=A0A8J6BGK1_ELECQ|nr:hypothetical protein GDO78_019655 [Eleutherodactylus coqui]